MSVFDYYSHYHKEMRCQHHLTLDNLIESFQQLPQTYLVVFEDGSGMGNPHSYRGYYDDLAFEETETPLTVKEMWKMCCQECLYQSFEGYKGGHFIMNGRTSVWKADYGCSGEAIVKIEVDDLAKRVIIKSIKS